ncbi:MAG TPA: IS110 family transposase, partial [Ktedonobacteraceae bacterium]|nr:IS110 family transposase [Ktedonobacteraceae bacterium]
MLQHGLLRASFVPSQKQQDLRDFTRLRASLVQEQTQLVNRVHKVLEAAGCKLSGVLSDILGWPEKRILQAMCAGEIDPVHLASLMRLSVRAKPEEVVAALTAEGREHERFLLRELLILIGALDCSIRHLEEHLSPFEEDIERGEK